MMVAVIALSIGSFLAVIIGTVSGMGGADFAQGVWPAVAVTPYFGLPFAILLLISLVIVSAKRRTREAAANAQRTPPRKAQRKAPRTSQGK